MRTSGSTRNGNKKTRIQRICIVILRRQLWLHAFFLCVNSQLCPLLRWTRAKETLVSWQVSRTRRCRWLWRLDMSKEPLKILCLELWRVTTSWRLRAAYMKDKTSDSKVLATIVAPTEADPYTCLCIKWFMREIPGYLSPFVHSRDFLVMEATGIAVDEYGERYGYYFLHEFHHPLLPVLNALEILRCGISQGYISRQVRPDKVHFFTRGFVDPRGDVPVSIAVQLSAETTVAATSTAETSYTKKLGWLMARERHRRRQTLTTPRTTCSCNHSKSSSLLACQVYAECFCSRCVVQKKFVVDMTTSEVIERVLPFFFGCVLKAKEMSPHEVAVDTVVRPRSCLQTPTGSSTY